jgi:hypothetical protein
MAMQTTATTTEIIYPETDGEPMASNTQQAEVMMTIKENLDALFADRPDVFVAIDHFTKRSLAMVEVIGINLRAAQG